MSGISVEGDVGVACLDGAHGAFVSLHRDPVVEFGSGPFHLFVGA